MAASESAGELLARASSRTEVRPGDARARLPEPKEAAIDRFRAALEARGIATAAGGTPSSTGA